VVRNDGTDGKPHKLGYGVHRVLGLMELGVDAYFFDVIECSPVDLQFIRLCENENDTPKLNNSEEDIIWNFGKMLEKNVISNTEEAIIKKLKTLFPRRAKLSRDRIAEAIFTRQKTPLKFASYNEAKVRRWLDNHVHYNIAIGGELDTDRDQYGFVTMQGSLYRTFYRAITKFAETGKTSYMNCHIKGLSGGSTLKEQRQKVLNEYIDVRVRYAQVFGVDKKFLMFNGFLPQAVGVDKWYDVVPVPQDKIDADVAHKIKNGLQNVFENA
jgi:hypothetical protein